MSEYLLGHYSVAVVLLGHLLGPRGDLLGRLTARKGAGETTLLQCHDVVQTHFIAFRAK